MFFVPIYLLYTYICNYSYIRVHGYEKKNLFNIDVFNGISGLNELLIKALECSSVTRKLNFIEITKKGLEKLTRQPLPPDE